MDLLLRTGLNPREVRLEFVDNSGIHVVHAIPGALEEVDVGSERLQQIGLGSSPAAQFARIILIRLRAINGDKRVLREFRESGQIERAQGEPEIARIGELTGE